MSFANERKISAVKKARPCVACGQRIEVGSPASDWTGMTEGQFVAVTYHAECRAAEVALNDMHRTYYEDWQALEDAEAEDWAALAEDHPVAAARFRGAVR